MSKLLMALAYKMKFFAHIILLSLTGCSETEVTYHPKDSFSEESFKFLLEQNSLEYDILDDGYIAVRSDERHLIESLLASAEAGDDRSTFRLLLKCESEEFEVSAGKKVPYLKEVEGSEFAVYTLRSSDLGSIGGMGVISYVKERCR